LKKYTRDFLPGSREDFRD